MAKDATFTMRMGTELLQRVADLEAVMQTTPEAVAWNVSKAAVVRLALQIGLEALEARYCAPAHAVRHHERVLSTMAKDKDDEAKQEAAPKPPLDPAPDPTKRWCSTCQRTIPTARWAAHLKSRAHQNYD